jgi:hypothetical protein
MVCKTNRFKIFSAKNYKIKYTTEVIPLKSNIGI